MAVKACFYFFIFGSFVCLFLVYCLSYSSPQSFFLLLLCPFQSSSFERFARLIGCKWYYRLSLIYIITFYSVLFIFVIYFLLVCWFDGIILFPSKGYSKGKLAYCLSGRDNRVHRFIQRSRQFVKQSRISIMTRFMNLKKKYLCDRFLGKVQ